MPLFSFFPCCVDFSYLGMIWTLWVWGLAAPWLHTVTAATMGTELTSRPPPLTGKRSKMQFCFLKSDLDGLCSPTTQNTNIWTATLSPSDVSVDINHVSSVFCTPSLICSTLFWEFLRDNLKVTWSILVSQYFLHLLYYRQGWINKLYISRPCIFKLFGPKFNSYI